MDNTVKTWINHCHMQLQWPRMFPIYVWNYCGINCFNCCKVISCIVPKLSYRMCEVMTKVVGVQGQDQDSTCMTQTKTIWGQHLHHQNKLLDGSSEVCCAECIVISIVLHSSMKCICLWSMILTAVNCKWQQNNNTIKVRLLHWTYECCK